MHRILLLIVFVLVPAVNYASTMLPRGDSQFDDYGKTRVDAATWAFAIWGVIFTGMILFSIAMLTRKSEDPPSLKRAQTGLIVAGLASIAFVPISIYLSDTITWIDIMVHLGALMFAVWNLRAVAAAYPENSFSRWTWFGPSMYLGWISAASVIATALMLQDVGISVADHIATIVACATIVFVGGVAIWMAWKRDPIYAMTIVWALVAVGVRQADFLPVRYASWGMAAAVIVVTVITLMKRRGFYAVTATS